MDLNKLQTALQFFSKICDVQNVPVGIVTTSESARFAVQFSLSPNIVVFDSIEPAAQFIYDKYFEFVCEQR